MDKTQTFNMRVVDYICMSIALGVVIEKLAELTGQSVEEITAAMQQEASERVDLLPPEYADKAISDYYKDAEAGAPYLITDISL